MNKAQRRRQQNQAKKAAKNLKRDRAGGGKNKDRAS